MNNRRSVAKTSSDPLSLSLSIYAECPSSFIHISAVSLIGCLDYKRPAKLAVPNNECSPIGLLPITYRVTP